MGDALSSKELYAVPKQKNGSGGLNIKLKKIPTRKKKDRTLKMGSQYGTGSFGAATSTK